MIDRRGFVGEDQVFEFAGAVDGLPLPADTVEKLDH
jgi:hypothetical protein